MDIDTQWSLGLLKTYTYNVRNIYFHYGISFVLCWPRGLRRPLVMHGGMGSKPLFEIAKTHLARVVIKTQTSI